MERLTADRISSQGIANLAGAIIVDAARTYIRALHEQQVMPSERSMQTLERTREFLRETPWNFTGMTGDELIDAIETEDKRRRARTR